MVELVSLGSLEVVRLLSIVCAAVAHTRIEPERVKIVSEIIMKADLRLRALAGARSEESERAGVAALLDGQRIVIAGKSENFRDQPGDGTNRLNALADCVTQSHCRLDVAFDIDVVGDECLDDRQIGRRE